MLKNLMEIFGLSETFVKYPLAGLVTVLIASEAVMGFFLVRSLNANNEYEAALRKCEAERLEISRTAFDIGIGQMEKLMKLREMTERKAVQIDSAKTAVEKLKK